MARELTRRRRSSRDEDAYTPADDDQDEDQGTEDEAPRGRRGSRRGSSEKPSGRKVHTEDDGDEDEAPRSRRSGRSSEKAESKPSVGKGWGAYKATREETKSGDYADEFKPSDEETLIKFLDEEPFAVYKQHWIERPGKRSWNCIGDDCPLCDAGDKPRLQAMINVVDMLADDPKVLIWTAGPAVMNILENFTNEEAPDRTKPLNKPGLYFSVSRSGDGKKKKYQFHISPVKERDLQEDWDVTPLTEDEFEAFYDEGYDDDQVYFPKRSDLKEIARELSD